MSVSTYPQLTAPTAVPHPQPPATLADLLAELPVTEQRQFRRQWRFLREAFSIADQIVRRPLPGADQAEQLELLLGFVIYRGRLLRRSVRRARGAELVEVAS